MLRNEQSFKKAQVKSFFKKISLKNSHGLLVKKYIFPFLNFDI